MAFVPRPIRRSAGMHTVRAGQNPATIAGLYGQPASSYRDLVAANSHRPLSLAGVPQGNSATFASLGAGDELRLPWFWFEGKNEGARRMLPPGTVGDAQQDSIDAAILAILSPAAKTPEAKAVLPAAVNALGLWYRQDHPGGGVPTVADILPYSNTSADWWKRIGQKLPPDVAASIPWNETKWRGAAKLVASGLDLQGINWGQVNSLLETSVKPGMFASTDLPIDWKQSVDFSGSVPGTAISWGALPWSKLGDIRWDLLPIEQIDLSKAPKAGALTQTQWLIAQIKSALGFQQGAGQGGSQDVAPPPNCASVGPNSYPIVDASGHYTGECFAGCGANAFQDTDKLCTCKPGFVIDPALPNSGDCIPDPSAITQNQKSCPNGGTFWVGNGGAVGCKCPDGTITALGPTGGCPAAVPSPPAAAADSTTTPLLIVGGLALGAIALYFANRK